MCRFYGIYAYVLARRERILQKNANESAFGNIFTRTRFAGVCGRYRVRRTYVEAFALEIQPDRRVCGVLIKLTLRSWNAIIPRGFSLFRQFLSVSFRFVLPVLSTFRCFRDFRPVTLDRSISSFARKNSR